MTRDLLIIGTSGLAKEAAHLARCIDPDGQRWPVVSYVADSAQQIGTQLLFGRVDFCDEDLESRFQPADVVIGIGHPGTRRAVAGRLANCEALQFPNLIHPLVKLNSAYVQLGMGNMVTLGVAATCDIRIGNFNLVNLNSTIGHDTVIGSYNVINPGCNVSGRVRIGDACLFGTGCSVLEDIEIASGVTVGAGAVVVRSIAEPGTWIGVPARRLQPR